MNQQWRSQAACRTGTGVDPSIFFPEKGGTARPAKKVCIQCPVRDKCEAWIMATEDPSDRHGVVAGLTVDERKAKYSGGFIKQRDECDKGHALLVPGVDFYEKSNGTRECKPCKQERDRDAYLARKEQKVQVGA